jgi:hypothetical protein
MRGVEIYPGGKGTYWLVFSLLASLLASLLSSLPSSLLDASDLLSRDSLSTVNLFSIRSREPGTGLAGGAALGARNR